MSMQSVHQFQSTEKSLQLPTRVGELKVVGAATLERVKQDVRVVPVDELEFGVALRTVLSYLDT